MLRIRLAPRRRAALACAAAASALATLPYLSIVVGRSTGMYEDTTDQYLPKILAVWRAVKAGHAPWWSPLQYGGFNLLGFGQAGIFYPPNLLFAVMSPIAAHRWWLVVHVWLAASGAALWSWTRWRHRPAAIVSGVAYALCGFMVLHLMHMVLIASAAWLPWALLGVDRLLERWSIPNALLIAVPTAMCAVVGHPQGLWQLLVAVSISAGIQVVGGTELRLRAAALRFARPIGAAMIGVGLGAVQLLPQFLLGRTSVRPTLSKADAFAFSLSPHHLMTSIAPWLFGGNSSISAHPWLEPGEPPHEYIFYLGASVLVLAIIGVLAQRKDARSISLVVLAVFAALAALGGRTPFGTITYHLVPFASAFRAWSRNAILISVAVSCLAGAGVRAICMQPRRWRMHLTVLLLVATTVLALNRLAMLHDSRTLTGGAWLVAAGVPMLALVALIGISSVPASRQRAVAVLLVAVVSADMIGFTLTSPWRFAQKPATSVNWALGNDTAFLGATFDAAGGVDRWYSNSLDTRGWALTRNTPGLVGYDPLLQRNIAAVTGLDYFGNSSRDDLWEPTWIADVFRITTLFLPPEIRVTDPLAQAPRDDGRSLFVRYTRTPRLPEAYLVSDVREASLDSIVNVLRSDPRQGTDLRHTAFVEPDGPHADVARALTGTPVAAGSASGVMRPEGRGTYTVNAEAASLLVVSYSWLPGWTARVDGHSTAVTRVNGVVLGVVVPAGAHTVSLRFSPPGLRSGLLISFIALLVLVTPTVALRLREVARRHRPQDPNR